NRSRPARRYRNRWYQAGQAGFRRHRACSPVRGKRRHPARRYPQRRIREPRQEIIPAVVGFPMHWQPTASQAALQARAALNQQIRQFFAARGVMEVETPLLSQGCGTDPYLDPVSAAYQARQGAEVVVHYLQTSPEFAMKRLLAAGSGAIYQLCKA